MQTINNTEICNLENLIYFDVQETGYLTKAEGEFYKFEDNLIFLNDDSDSVIRCQNKMFPLKYLSEEYENIYITYIPAKELDYYSQKPKEEGQINLNEFENLFPNPLIKISKKNLDNNSNFIKCFLSGKRSAILINKSLKALRLKGCGNLFIGFNLSNVDDLGKNHLEIRGAQFKNTCLREQFITNKVYKECVKRGLICGNIPIGFYRYKSLPQPLINESSMIDKYCGLFLTEGDKRFGCNFFNGLNIILDILFSDELYCKLFSEMLLCDGFKKLSENLPQKNFNVNNNNDIVIDFNNLLFENPLLNKVADEYKYDRVFFNYLEFLFTSNNFCNSEDLLQLEIKLLKNYFNNNENCQTIINKISTILSEKRINIFILIQIIISKMTYEVGYIKKMFEEMELNWGTYDYHCNAHLDNLLVLPFNEKKLYLAPLDFDLGFTRAEFIDLNYKNAKGIENNLNFDELLEREKNNFTVQLLGFNPIPNIDVKVLAIEKTLDKNTNYKLMIENIVMIMKENMIEYYSQGYLKLREVGSGNNLYGNYFNFDFDSFYDAGNDLVKLILFSEINPQYN